MRNTIINRVLPYPHHTNEIIYKLLCRNIPLSWVQEFILEIQHHLTDDHDDCKIFVSTHVHTIVQHHIYTHR